MMTTLIASNREDVRQAEREAIDRGLRAHQRVQLVKTIAMWVAAGVGMAVATFCGAAMLSLATFCVA